MEKRGSAGLLSVLLLLAIVPVFWRAGTLGLVESEETRYALIGREMLASGDWLVPRLDGVAYLEKPPLTAWATALGFAAFGDSEFTARLVSIVSCLLILYFTFRIGKLLESRELGLLACCILASSPLFFGMGRILSTDTLFTAATTAGLFFLLALGARQSVGLSLGLGVSLAAAVLTKGPVGLVVIGMAAFALALAARSWEPLLQILRPAALLPFLALSVPWFVMVQIKIPAFFDFFIVRHHLARFLGSNPEDKDLHAAGAWYYLPVMAGGFFAWTVSLWGAARSAWRDFGPTREILDRRALWIFSALVFCFFTAGSGKRVPYLLPLFPAVAVGIAVYLGKALREEPQPGRKLWPSVCTLGLVLPTLYFVRNQPVFDAARDAWGRVALGIGIFLGVSLATAAVLLVRRNARAALAALMIANSGLFVLTAELASVLEPQLSMKPVIEQADLEPAPQVPLVCVGGYLPGVTYYSHRPIFIFGSLGELEFGTGLGEKSRSEVLGEVEFRQRLETPGQLVIVGSAGQIRRKTQEWDPERKKFRKVSISGRWGWAAN